MKIEKLRINKNFTPCPAATRDELFRNGFFVFNITRMIEYIQNNPDSFFREDVAVSDFFSGFSSINESHIDSVELSMPVIIAEISPGQYNLIDGNHRMEKARRMGIKNVPAYKLSSVQHLKFLISKEAYLSYIEYWNSKV